MPGEPRIPRRYHAPGRVENAARTRRAVLAAARELFTSNGYAATTVAQIAREAGVAVDTVYAAVGRKPMLIRELLGSAVPSADSDVQGHSMEPSGATAEEQIDRYAETVPLTAPVHKALREAAAVDPECASLTEEIAQRRAAEVNRFAAQLQSTGEVRPELSEADVADVVWSMNSTDYFLLLSERSWTPARFRIFLADAWRRLLLRPARSR
ncbi:MAG: TetR/AcrR family transcriptional regulator [Geodermatophilaceae bacterium]